MPDPQPAYAVTVNVSMDGDDMPAMHGDITIGNGLIYNRRSDTVTIRARQGVFVSIVPGKRFATRLGKLLDAVYQNENTEETFASIRCQHCGAPVRTVSVDSDKGSYVITLDDRPADNGLYIMTGDTTARLLRPMEQPTAPLYKRHVCQQGGNRVNDQLYTAQEIADIIKVDKNSVYRMVRAKAIPETDVIRIGGVMRIHRRWLEDIGVMDAEPDARELHAVGGETA